MTREERRRRMVMAFGAFEAQRAVRREVLESCCFAAFCVVMVVWAFLTP